MKENKAICGKSLTLSEHTNNKLHGGLRLKNDVKVSKPDRPLVTVITVVLNNEKTIEKCLSSVARQTYKNIEHILIDGQSIDNTLDIIKKHECFLDYFVSEPDSGVYDAMNKGLTLAKGEYILFLNADDWYREDAVEKLLSNSIKYNVDITYADASIVNSDGIVYKRLNSWLHDGMYTLGAPLRHETMLVRSEVYNKYGFYDNSYQIISDYIYMIVLYKNGCSFKHVREPLLFFSDTGKSNVDYATIGVEREKFFKSLFPFLDGDDLSIMKKHGNLTIKNRIKLILKHRWKCILFMRSMIFNVVNDFLKLKFPLRIFYKR